MKRIIALLCCVAMLLSICVAATETVPTISVSTVKASPGETVDVLLSISNNTGIAGATISITYDGELTLNSSTEGTAFSSLSLTQPTNYSYNPVRFLWFGNNDDTSDGTLVTMSFTAPTKLGTYVITPSYASEDITNYTGEYGKRKLSPRLALIDRI